MREHPGSGDVTMLAHLLDHANELRESPVELVQDAVEEGRRHVFVHAQQLGHVLLQQQRWTRLCTNHTRAHVVTSGAATLHHQRRTAAGAERGAARVEVGGAEVRGGGGASQCFCMSSDELGSLLRWG